MVRKQETKWLLLRQDVKAWLEKEAARTLASQNSEIVRCIRARMDADQPKRAIQTYLTAPLSFSRAVDRSHRRKRAVCARWQGGHADDRLYVVKKSFPSPGLYRGILKRFHYATSTHEAVREDGR